MDATRGPSAAAVNSDDAAAGALDQLCGMIRKCDKRIDGFGHCQVLQNNGAWPGYGIAASWRLLARWPVRRFWGTAQ
jgi:hypothetical protein